MARWLEVGWKLNVGMNVGYMSGRMLLGYWVKGLKDECWMNRGSWKDTWKVDGWVMVVWRLNG